MKITKIINLLLQVIAEHGDIEVQLQETQPIEGGFEVIEYPNFFIIPSIHETEHGTVKVICNIRHWSH